MLSFDPEITDDEDEPDNSDAVYDAPTLAGQLQHHLNADGQQRSSLINKILESSASLSPRPQPQLPQPHPDTGAANPCEGPSFSQRLQLNDTDVTNCTELNARRSSIRPSLSAVSEVAAAAAGVCSVPPPPPVAVDAPTVAYNQTLSQMERLEITASSADLFAGSDNDGSRNSSHLDQQQHHRSPSEAISNLSVGVQQINLLSSDPVAPDDVAPARNCRQTVFSISSSSSSDSSASDIAAEQQPSTRSSLASADVYDVITLSDSQSEQAISVYGEPVAGDEADPDAVAAAAQQSAGDVSLPVAHNNADPLDDMPSPAAVCAADVAASAAPASVASLPSSVQHRLDNFFDNIPLLSSDPTGTEHTDTNDAAANDPVQLAHASGRSSPVDVAAVAAMSLHSNSSVYVSETDEDQFDTSSDSVNDASLHLPSSDVLQSSDTPKSSRSRRPATSSASATSSAATVPSLPPPVPSSSELVPMSSEPITITQSTQPSTFSAAVRKDRAGSRTPTVSIAAKFQIRIQVNRNGDDTTSESSASTSNNTSRASSRSDNQEPAANSPPPTAAAAATTTTDAVREQTDRMSEMRIEEVQLADPPAATTPRPAGRKLQLDKLKTPKAATKPTSRPTTPASAPRAVHDRDAAAAADGDFIQPPPCTAVGTPDKPKIVLDSAAQQLLNELYGATWQTPDLLKKCVIRRPTMAPPATAVKATPPPATGGRLPATAGKAAKSKTRTKAQQQKAPTAKENVAPLADSRCSQDFSLCKTMSIVKTVEPVTFTLHLFRSQFARTLPTIWTRRASAN